MTDPTVRATRAATTRLLALLGAESGDDAATIVRAALRAPGGVETFARLVVEEMERALDRPAVKDAEV